VVENSFRRVAVAVKGAFKISLGIVLSFNGPGNSVYRYGNRTKKKIISYPLLKEFIGDHRNESARNYKVTGK